MPQRQIFCAAYRCGKTQRLVDVAAAALRSGMPHTQILALAVHRPAAAVLREMLHAATGRDIPTTTLRQRALAILQDTPAAAQLPSGWSEAALLSGIDRRRLMRQAWARVGAEHPSLFARRGHQPGALDWLALLFDRFSDWCGTADPHRLPDLRPADAGLAELWHAYRAYLHLCRQHGVVAFNEVFNRAVDALRVPEVRQNHTRHLLLLDDLDLWQPAELLFVAALIGPQSDVYAACANAPHADSPLALERLLHRWTMRHALQPVTIDAAAPPAPEMSVGEYATPDAEAHAIARRIAALTRATGQPDDAAIVAFDPELVPLLQRALPQYGLPVQGQTPRDGYTLALAPLAVAGLKLLTEQPLTPAETIALLQHPALGLSIADAHAAVEAVEQQRFQPFALDDQRWPAALSAAGRERLTEMRSATAAARTDDQPPSAQIQRWLARLDLDARAWEQSATVLEPWAVMIDRQHWTRLLDFLRQSEALNATLGTPLTIADAVEVFTAAQALIPPQGQPHAHAIPIWQPSALGGCTARLVFAAGLHEGALPQPIQPLPLADDTALIEAFGALPGFVAPQHQDRAAAWERATHDLQRVVGRALEAIHLSYSRTDRQGRARLPSPVLAATIGASLDRHGRLQCAEGRPPVETALPDERADTTFTLWPQSFVTDSLIATQPSLDLPPLPVESPFQVSPSALEDYFTCPRRCFYARMLGLYDVVSSPRQTLGQVVHDALNDLLHESQGAAIDETGARALVARHWIADDHRWGSRLKQIVFRQLAEQAVLNYARYEAERAEHTTFLGGELRFHWPLPDIDTIITGRLDRIDRSAAGLHVIDYKLGQHSPSINDLLGEFVPPRDPQQAAAWRPGDIQLPVYALALEQGTIEGLELQPGERVATMTLVYPLALYGDSGRLSARGRREIRLIDHRDEACPACAAQPERSPKTGTLCREQLAAVEQRVREAVLRMRAAEWQPDPREGSQTCAGCAFRPICSDPQ
ncbi:MAG TPA: PD-(D/E)XK nuclease family protein [Herpetosiphonaceae bacterium]